MAKSPTTARKSPRPLILVTLLLVFVAAAVAVNARYLAGAPVRERLERGAAHAQAHRYDDAEQEWRAALRLDPNRPEPYRLLSTLYLQTGRPDLAVPLLENLRRIAPKTEHTLCSLAEAYARNDQPDKAAEAARQGVVIEPQCPQAHALLGIQLSDSQDARGAVAELSRAVALAPADGKIGLSLAQAQLQAGDLPACERAMGQVISHNPKYARAWYMLGDLLLTRYGKIRAKEAAGAFSRALELQPDAVDALIGLGHARIALGDPAGAAAPLRKAWDRGARSPQLAADLAQAYRAAGARDAADRFAAERARLAAQTSPSPIHQIAHTEIGER